MKSYTDLEQSKKLAKILPFESADIILTLKGNSELTSYPIMRNYSEFYNYLRIFELEEKYIKRTYIPAWSLSALLKLIPPGNILLRDALSGKYKCINTVDSDLYDNPVDAAYEMVVWLKENKKL